MVSNVYESTKTAVGDDVTVGESVGAAVGDPKPGEPRVGEGVKIESVGLGAIDGEGVSGKVGFAGVGFIDGDSVSGNSES